jgi:ABC-2 type transport system ATP-binding protein
MILDEPFSGFDPVNADLIKNEILELRDKGTTVIFSTHRMESVEELCDQIALINKSKKILDGAKNEIKDEYRKGLYEIEFKGGISENGTIRIHNQEQSLNGRIHATIEDVNRIGSNSLLRKLIEEVEVHAFREKVPSINEIFISKVKDSNG